MIFDEMQEAEIRVNFRRMYHDIGMQESFKVLQEIIITAALLAEILSEEMDVEIKDNYKKVEESPKDQDMDPS